MKIILIILLIIVLLIICITLFVNLHPVLGGKSKIFTSENFKNGKFQNLYPTSLQTGTKGVFGIIKEYITSQTIGFPLKVIPTEQFNVSDFINGSFVWFGHSSILMNIENTIIMTDPVYYKASPIAIGGTPFHYSHTPAISDLPNIDVVIISHDHYDHLDYQSIIEMDSKVSKYLVPLGVKSHFSRWGIDESKVEELDWEDSTKHNNINFIFTPAQHFSGRGLLNRSSTLWGSWVIKGENNSFYFSGDSGYFDGFKEIGKKYGPFDIAFIENGAYNDSWNEVHMYPEQSVQAGIDVQAKNVMPIHWGKFDLALHDWYEPIERFIKESEKLELKYFHPKIGEIFTLNNLPKNNWWQELK